MPALGFEPKKILLIRLKAIGDVVLCTPLIRALKKAYPVAQIHMATDEAPAPVLYHNPHLDLQLVAPSREASLSTKLAFFKTLRRGGYDLVLDLFGNPRSAWMSLFTGARVRAGYAYRIRKMAFTHAVPKNKVRKYQVEVNLDLLRHLGIPVDGLRTEVFLEPKEVSWADEVLDKFKIKNSKLKIGLNPTGTWGAKRWPVSHWRELVEKINGDFGVKPLVFWGPGDQRTVDEIREGLGDQLFLSPRTDLRQLMALISRLDLLVGNDGAPQHLAQALGVKSLTVFGPTWGISWTQPSDPRHRFLQRFLDCGPCDRTLCPFPEEGQGLPHSHKECLSTILPSQVATLAGTLLGPG